MLFLVAYDIPIKVSLLGAGRLLGLAFSRMAESQGYFALRSKCAMNQRLSSRNNPHVYISTYRTTDYCNTIN